MIAQGKVCSVETYPSGSAVMQAYAAGALVLEVGFFLDLQETGGQVTINGTIYGYTMDPVSSTITLLTPLVADVDDGDQVLAYPPSKEKRAYVDTEDGQDAIIAIVPHFLQDDLDEGIREENFQETVLIEEVRGVWVVQNIVALEPLSGIATRQALSDAAAALVAANAASGVADDALTSANSKNAVSHQDYAPTTEANTAGDVWYQHDVDTGHIVGQWTGLGGTSWVSDQISHQVIASVDLGTATVGKLAANYIDTGTLTAALTLTGYLLAGNPTGARVVIDEEGIRQYDSDGNLLTNIPTDPDLPATFEGAVIADSLVIKDYMSLQGLANKVARGAVLTLEEGTSSPSSAPSVAVAYDKYEANIGSYLMVKRGFHIETDGGTDAHWGDEFFGYGQVRAPGGKWYNWPQITMNGSKTSTRSVMGFTVLRTSSGIRHALYVGRGVDGGTDRTWHLEIQDPSVMTTDGTVAPAVKCSLLHGDPSWVVDFRLGRAVSSIGSSALDSNFAMVRFYVNTSTGNKITFRRFSATDAAITQQGSDLQVNSPMTADEKLGGVTYGSSARMLFPGADQMIWLLHGSVNTYAFSSTGTRLPDFDFPTAPGDSVFGSCGSLASGAMTFARFLSSKSGSDGPIGGFEGQSHPVTKYTNNHWVGSTSPKWWLSTTNHDADITGGTHESMQGPRAALTMKKRAGLTVTVPPYPVRPSPTTTDDPLSAKIYLGRGTGDPGRTYMEFAGQTDDPNRTLYIGTFAFPAGLAATPPPASSNFPTSSPAKLQSSSVGSDGLPRVLIDGSGLLHGETLDVSGAGASALQGKAFEQLYYSIRSQSMLIGGGLISCSSTYEVKWSSRLMIISAGRGPTLAVGGYFQLDLPSVGATITGYGGATNKTVTANGIPLNAWDALWYELPYGSAQTSVPGNFKVTSYTSNFTVPNNWVLICIRNGDGTNRVEFTTGDRLLAGQDNQLYLSSATAMTAATGWTVNTQSCAQVGRVVQYYFIATRTGATIASNANGDIGNTSIATIDVDWRPVQPINLSGAIANGTLWGGYINAAGTLTLSALQANVSLASGAQISGSGTGLLA